MTQDYSPAIILTNEDLEFFGRMAGGQQAAAGHTTQANGTSFGLTMEANDSSFELMMAEHHEIAQYPTFFEDEYSVLYAAFEETIAANTIQTAVEQPAPVQAPVGQTVVEESTAPATAAVTVTNQTTANKIPRSTPKKAAKRGVNGFAVEETEQLKKVIQLVCEERGMTEDQMRESIWSDKGRKNEEDLWNRLALVLPQRTQEAIMRHVKRQYHPFDRSAWTPEWLEILRRAVDYQGKKWQIIGKAINRHPDDCRDTFRDKLSTPGHATGAWSNAEVDLLQSTVTQVEAEQRGKWRNANPGQSDANIPKSRFIPAGLVAERMGGVRTRVQVQLKLRQMGVKSSRV